MNLKCVFFMFEYLIGLFHAQGHLETVLQKAFMQKLGNPRNREYSHLSDLVLFTESQNMHMHSTLSNIFITYSFLHTPSPCLVDRADNVLLIIIWRSVLHQSSDCKTTAVAAALITHSASQYFEFVWFVPAYGPNLANGDYPSWRYG